MIRLALVLLLVSVSVIAQDEVEERILRVRTQLVNVLVSVVDQRGNLVKGLTRDDFEILEDGVRQEINLFGHSDTVPLRMAVLIDLSLSVKPRLKFQKEAAEKFFKSVLRPTDTAALFSFNHDVTLEQDFTSDKKALISALKRLKSGGGTALYDAIYLAAQRLSRSTSGRRVMVILSDGINTVSKTTLDAALRMTERAEAVIYGIYTVNRLPEEPTVVAGENLLKQLCERTGGQVFFPSDSYVLEEVFEQLSQVLRAQYLISFYSNSERNDGSYRRIEVQVKDPTLKVRSRAGYYAPKD
ncbi:MAG: VWA domain-containing protein [Acidobacteriota bacterium]|nr:VWA domain-containing protein [Blastocatellia bacterium]MDW8412820.1 VWA domain-containing protein [Acidobacteriota bacterium]